MSNVYTLASRTFFLVIACTATLLCACAQQEPAQVILHDMASSKRGSSTTQESTANPYKVTAKSGQTLYDISKEYGVGLRDLMELNRIRPPYTLSAGQAIRLPNPQFHMVKPGDTLYSVSRSYGMDVSSITRTNHMSPPYVLKSGTKLRLPSQTTYEEEPEETRYSSATMPASPIARSDISASDLAPVGSSPSVSSREMQPIGASDNPFSETVDSSAPQPIAKNRAAVSENEDSPFGSQQVTSRSLDQQPGDDNPFSNQPASHQAERPNPVHDSADNSDNPFEDQAPKKAVAIAEMDPNSPKPILKPGSEYTVMTGHPAKEFSPPPAPKAVVVPAPAEERIAAAEKEPEAQPVPERETEDTSASSKPVDFSWPVGGGRVVSRFGPKEGGLYNDGINIAAPLGTSIKSAADGHVVYAGNELRGYGNLLLIRHDDGLLTAYAHTKENLVNKGDFVKKGQTIAYIGKTGHVSSPQLHFSIRKGRKALDPEKFLPQMVSSR